MSTRPNPWIICMAWAIPLCVLPSAIWRLLVIAEEPENWWYFVVLSAGSVVVASLAVGLVSPWGERVPAHIPMIGGRDLSPRIVTSIAIVGAVIIMSIATIYVFNYFTAEAARPDLQIVGDPGTDTRPVRERPQVGQITATYAPMLAWGPMLIIVAISYYRRTRASGSIVGEE